MARGRPRRMVKDVPTGRRSGGTSLEKFDNGIRLDIRRPSGNPADTAARRAELARQKAAKLKEQKRQLVKDLDEANNRAKKAANENKALIARQKELQAREDERILSRQDESMMSTQEGYNAHKAAEQEARKAARQEAAKKAAFTRDLNKTIKELEARKVAKETAEQEAKRQAEAVAKRQAKAAELKAAHDNYISMRRNDAIIFADEAGIPAREFLESADDSAIEFWALSTRPKPGGFESARLEQLRKEIDPQNLEKLDLLVGRYKEAAKKHTGAGGAPEGTDRFDPTVEDALRNEVERIDAARANRATSEPPAIDTKAWGQSLGKMTSGGRDIGKFLWKWFAKKPVGLAVRNPRRALATLALGAGGLAGLGYYLGSKRGAETAQEVSNIKANMEEARKGFEDFIVGPDTGISYDEDRGATLPWINELPDDATAGQAAAYLIKEIDTIQAGMKKRYAGFSSGTVDEATRQKVQDLWTVYNSAGMNTSANRWRNMKEELATRHPQYYALLTGDSKEQEKIFHEIDDAMKAQAAQAGGGK